MYGALNRLTVEDMLSQSHGVQATTDL